MSEFTVIVSEKSSPFPPVSPFPLMYDIDISEAKLVGVGQHSNDPVVLEEIKRLVANQRYAEVGGDIATASSHILLDIAEGLEVHFLTTRTSPVLDYRD